MPLRWKVLLGLLLTLSLAGGCYAIESLDTREPVPPHDRIQPYQRPVI